MGGNDMLCSIHGDIDHHNARVIRMQIDDELYKQRPKKLTLDLSRVEIMDSSGLGLILGRFNKASEIGTEFTLLNPADSVRKILDVAGIARMIKIERKK
jgi:stage II sporulation protein AA (anti-sigma F factor antagonist)